MIRIVKLHFKKEHIQDFLNHFETVKFNVNSFPGCLGMKLLQDLKDPCTVFTYSHWRDPEDLEKYRTSETFGEIWPTIKPWFDQKAEAWSVDEYFNGFDHQK